MDCRDWLSTLWASSFKGFPFYVERDDESGGRRVVVHEFPFRDDTFNEDLGESPRIFTVSAYLASDLVDAEGVAFLATLRAEGPGPLVRVLEGPVDVRLQTFKRSRDRDRFGYLAFDLTFVRDEGGLPNVSDNFFANELIGAVDDLVGVASAVFARVAAVVGFGEAVVEGLQGAAEDAVSTFEAIRTSASVEPAASASARDKATAAFRAIPTLVAPHQPVAADLAAQVFDVARTIGDGMDPEAAARDFGAVADDHAPAAPVVTGTASKIQAARNAAEVARLVRLAALAAYAEAIVRREFRSRPEGVSTRAQAVERFDVELMAAGGGLNADLFLAIQKVRGSLVDYLSRRITDLAPVVTVETSVNVPSIVAAWALYGDPRRAGELVARNGVKHPSFMPLVFEALAT